MIQVTHPVRGSSHAYLKHPQHMGNKIKIRTKGGGKSSTNISLDSGEAKDPATAAAAREQDRKLIGRKKAKFFLKRSQNRSKEAMGSQTKVETNIKNHHQ